MVLICMVCIINGLFILLFSIQIPVKYEGETHFIEGNKNTIAGDITLELKEKHQLSGDYVLMNGNKEVCLQYCLFCACVYCIL